jgi:integrase
MARTAGQIKERGPNRWLVSVFLCRDTTGKKVYRSETVRGGRRAAEKALRAMLREKDSGRLVLPSRVSFGEFLEDWLEKAVKPRTRASTLASYRSTLNNYVVPELGLMRLDKLNAMQLQGLVAKLVAREPALTPRTIRYALTLVKSALRTAVRWRKLTWNPMEEVDPPSPRKRELQVPQADAIAVVLGELQRDDLWPLWCLMITTGLRPGEALGLQWPDIDLKAERLTVHRSLSWLKGGGWELTEPKTQAGRRTLTIPKQTVAVLRSHRTCQLEERMKLADHYTDQGFVFATPLGGPLELHNVRGRHFKPAVLRAARTCAVCGKGLVPTGKAKHLEHEGGRRFDHDAAPRPELAAMRPYDLRHLCASLLLAGGIDLKTVSVGLGHANAGFTLETYTHTVPGTQEKAAKVIGSAVFRKTRGKR